jgi:hypothetical protein
MNTLVGRKSDCFIYDNISCFICNKTSSIEKVSKCAQSITTCDISDIDRGVVEAILLLPAHHAALVGSFGTNQRS